jgi:hypothetical protein
MTALLTGLILVAASFGIVTMAGGLVWFWKNRQQMPRRHPSNANENEHHQKDYYLNHQGEYRRPEVFRQADKVNRAA